MNYQPKTWQDFRNAGLLFFINTVLHAFGWALILKTNEKNEVIEIFPARVSFRGFDEKSQDEEYTKIARHLAEEAPKHPVEIESGIIEFPVLKAKSNSKKKSSDEEM